MKQKVLFVLTDQFADLRHAFWATEPNAYPGKYIERNRRLFKESCIVLSGEKN